METNKAYLLKTWQLWLWILSFAFFTGGAYALVNYRLNSVEHQVEDLLKWKEIRVELLNDMKIKLSSMELTLDYIKNELDRTRNKR